MSSLKEMGMPSLDDLARATEKRTADERARATAQRAVNDLKLRGNEDSKYIAIVLEYILKKI